MVQEQGHQKVIITAGEQLDKAVVKSLERKERLEEEKKARKRIYNQTYYQKRKKQKAERRA